MTLLNLRSRLILALTLSVAALPIGTGAANKSLPRAATPTHDVFASTEPLQIQIEASDDAIAKLRQYEWQFGKQPEREAVQVTVRQGQTVYTNVALHLKGAAGSFRAVDDNPAVTLNFARFHKRQRFHGLAKLSLNNSVQDPTFISEQLSRELFLKAGIPVPRAAHAFVELNGRKLGLYVLTEGWDREFLKRHFRNTKGNLYDGGFVKDVDAELSVNSGDKPKDQSDRIALLEAAKEKNLTNRLVRLNKILDIDRFLTFTALEVMLWDWDGYPLNRNNWRLYHDLDTDRMVFMPHGMDQMFWKPEGSILPSMQGIVAKGVLQIPELRARYFERMKELRSAVFDPQAMTNRARTLAARFSAQLEAADPATAKVQRQSLTEFCDAIQRRGRSLDQQLAHPIRPTEFDANGYAQLSGWESKSEFGNPSLAETSADRKGPMLQISTQRGSSIGSWRSKLWLEEGKYHLEGKVKTQGLVADIGDSRGGAGFRTLKSRPENYVLGDSEWKPVEYDFTVNDPLTEIQILCEFRGIEGQAWFDLQSLRLRKAAP
jgi:hypothetical protein